MNKPKNHAAPVDRPGLPQEASKDGEPGWAAGLRKLYDSIVDEPLPDSFEDLLKKLDDTGEADAKDG